MYHKKFYVKNINKGQYKANRRQKHTILSNTDKCDIKHTSTPTKYVPNTDKSNIKHLITPTQHGLPDPILSQPDVIHVHQQKVKILAEMVQENSHKQNQKNSTNIHDI